MVTKTFFGLLSIKHGCLNGFDQLIYLASKVLSLRIDFGLLRNLQVNKKRNALTIQNHKWIFHGISIDSEVDGYLNCSNLIRPVVFILVKQVSMNNLTSYVIHVLSLTIFL